ncbi:MAG TPA: helix-turn-helix transcriptional regulator [Gemmatimonadaceae bacterium]|nr:helix-turn-helix transcriptional regulator [Gemmatimonadaceae bacterium]
MPRLTLDWLHLITLLGAVQGVFLAGALVAKRRNRTANRLLAATMLAFSISLATSVYHATGFEQVFPHFFGAAHPMPFLFGPLVYLYAVTAADRNRRLTRRDAAHFIPFVAVIVVGLPIYLMSGAEKVALYARFVRGDLPLHITVANQLKLVSGAIYAPATVLFLRRHIERVKGSYSTLERVNLRWLLWLSIAAAAIWLLAVVVNVLESTGLAVISGGDDIIALAVAALVYGIGYMGLRQPEIFRYETAEYRIPAELRPSPVPPAPPVVADPAPEATASDAPARYERSGLSDQEAKQLEAALLALMETERPWRDSDLTLADLATRLDTTPHKLSEVLNSALEQTFYDFVNGYRVREVQRRIAAGDTERVKMLAVAMDAGFASKSTFNLVFKKHTNQTPSDYRQTASR